ncbi:restriction endonuclease subunit S [Vibrio vulnificus]|uniref:restriction endonuclease subunit S n=1 Tax=Vibrio vulnificus TaxID=672 RepID=UPI0040595307
MSWPMVELKKLVLKVDKWNPVKDGGDDQITYIDLSSVDKDSKAIKNEDVQKIQACLAPSRARQLVDSADVLVATVRPNLNGVALVSSDYQGATASTGYCVLRPNNKLLDSKYLFYWVQTESFVSDMMGKATGANYPAVSDKIVKESQIPLPPLDEQKRIAAILDKADAIRQKRKQAIALADELLRSVFLEMFGDPVTNPKGWEEPVLSDIADVRSGVTKGKKLKEGTGITLPYMRVANVQDGYLDLNSVQMITVSVKEAEKCKLLSGDILLTEGGDPDKLGRGHVWNDEIENCIHQNHIFSVRVKNKEYVRPAFLSAVIGSQRGKRYFLKVGKQTTGIATINKTVLSEFCPIIPPLELQDAYLAVVRRIKNIQKKEGFHETTLFPSLSQKAFSGQL